MSDREQTSPPTPSKRALIIPTLLTLGAVAALLSLGSWQLTRDAARNHDWHAAQRDGEHPELRDSALSGPAEHVMWRRVRANAVFSGEPMLLSGASEGHLPGFRVMQVGTLEAGQRILVDRGFLAHEGVEKTVNAFAPDTQPVLLTGRVRPLTDSPDESPYTRKRSCASVWPPRSRASMLSVGWYVHTGEARVDYDWTSLHYAVQWFGLAVLVLAGWATWLWRRLGRRLSWSKGPTASERPLTSTLLP
jgi:cytochrome oxidase assembly protein ShyY1